MNFNLFDCEEPYSTFKLLETDRQELMTDKCAILFFELRKVNKSIDKADRKKLWLQLINAETEEDLAMIKETGVSEINKAIVIMHEMSEDEKIREMARLREKWILDENSNREFFRRQGLEEGRAEGRAEGKAEGRAEGRAEGEAAGIEKGEANKEKEIISKLRKKGFSEEEIKDILNS